MTGEHWTSIYEQKRTTEVSWFQPQPTLSLELLTAANAGADDAILDVGAGASVLVDHLLERGFRDVSVLDISAPALHVAQQRLGKNASKVAWIVADLLTWKPERRYKIWHDRAVFHFLTTAEDRARYLDILRAALDPDGYVIIATFAADGPTSCSGLPVARYSPQQLAEQFPRFTVVRAQREDHRTPGEVIQPFTWLLLAAPTD
ncbi:SAM-dependent methyltransferase [Micromonospora globispora]|uniref:SAM-dependent methyltransferase n=1 Tax=Micromonospora globispora TaxID=1450148 RepID=A0A317K4I6_9ACTN|nr:class I SAM-dependent methyltransferase [Micromonospora globispora]PWU47909.1 SAM-dependent methyltransferase [Micromonospora globispora]PWU62080.1 SAM-dependent methyltransferase [Micromonospora globispora]RQW94474.1 SAM-dependent methyltransferase [Micromonospora globispora]